MLQRYSPTSPLVAQHAEADSGFNIGEAIGFFWRQWKFIVAFVVVSFLVAVVWLAKETPRYTASAFVLLDPTKEKAPGVDAILSEAAINTTMIDSQIAIINSTTFMRRVVEKEKLSSDPEFGSGRGKVEAAPFFGSIRSLFTRAGSNSEGTEQGQAPAVNPDRSVDALKGATAVAPGRGYILSISVTAFDRNRAARLANAVADAYVVDKLESRFEAAKRASSWLNDRVADLRKQLRESEEAVANFRAEHGISQNANITLTQQQLSDLNARLVSARAETADKKAKADLFISSKGGQIQNLPDTVNSPLAASLREQASTVSRKIGDLRGRYSDNHPLVVNAQAELRDVQRAIAAETQRAIANLKNEYELAKAQQESLEQTLADVTGQSGLDSDTMITLRELERTAAVNKSLFEDFLQRSRVTQEQATFEPQQARVITPAAPPNAPSYPNKSRVLMLAVALGLALGVGAAYAKETLNGGFTTPKQIEEVLELPLLTSVMQMDARQRTVEGKIVPIPYFPAAKPLSRYSETMRTLRNGIQMTDVDNPPSVLQFTSSVPNEGKTTIGLSFVVSVASSGLKILYIDADLRHPSGTRFLNMEARPGLVDVLVGKVAPQDAIQYHDENRFWVLSAGSKTQNPTDLLSSERMKSLVHGLRKSFDYVIIDSPPVGPVIDPVIVSHLVDKVVFVVSWADTARELVQNSVQQLCGHKKVAGIVFNHVHENQAKKYGKYAYSYYYGSRYYKNYYTE